MLVHERDGEDRPRHAHGENNPQWKEFFDDEVMVVFAGPHAYVSPRWYEEKERVPAWNYAAVAYGVPKVVEDRKAKHESSGRLVAAIDPQWLSEVRRPASRVRGR